MIEDVNRRNVAGWVSAVDRSETRSADGTDRILRLNGYAVLFDTPSEPMGRVIETIAPTAFDNVLADENLDVRFQAEHTGLALARMSNGSLRITKDDRGLYFEVDLNPNVHAARDLYYLVERGDITQMSFGFTIANEDVTEQGDMIMARITNVARLWELSAVTFPAYYETLVSVVQMPIEPSDVLEEEPPSSEMWMRDILAARRLREEAID